MRSNRKKIYNQNFEWCDGLILAFLIIYSLLIIIPFVNVFAISFSTQEEYVRNPMVMIPKEPTLENYAELLDDSRILIGYRTSFIILLIGVPLNIFLTTSLAYGLSRPQFPGKKLVFYYVLFTMLFNGGIIPIYLLMKEMKLTNTLGSLILVHAVNTFYMVITRSYIQTLPDALMESARLDGAGEWRILFQIVLPLCKPILATILLFYSVDRWNEWFYAMIFIRKNSIIPLQMVLRSIVMESQAAAEMAAEAGGLSGEQYNFVEGLKMGAVLLTMLPVMCVYPFLQKYFTKGMLIGAIKA